MTWPVPPPEQSSATARAGLDRPCPNPITRARPVTSRPTPRQDTITPTRSPRRPPSVLLAAEALEARDAPATLVNPTTVVYSDVDGDRVTVRTTKGTSGVLPVNGLFGDADDAVGLIPHTELFRNLGRTRRSSRHPRRGRGRSCSCFRGRPGTEPRRRSPPRSRADRAGRGRASVAPLH